MQTRSSSRWRASCWWLFPLLMVVLMPVSPARSEQPAADWSQPAEGLAFERWYVVYLGPDRCGWARDRRWESPQSIVSRNDLAITISRGQVSVTVAVGTAFEETPAGEPIQVQLKQSMAGMDVLQHVRFGPDELTLTTTQGGQTRSRTAPRVQGQWLPPAAAARYVAAELAAGSRKITYQTVEPSGNVQPVTLTVEVVDEEAIEVMGKTVPALAVDVTASNLPQMKTRMHMDSDWTLLRSSLSMIPDMPLVMLAADRDLATSKLDPPDMLARSLIKPAGRIRQPRDLQRGVYELTWAPAEADQRDGGQGSPLTTLLQTGSQQVMFAEDKPNVARVVVDLTTADAADAKQAPAAGHLAATTMLNWEDPAVRELAIQAVEHVQENATDVARAVAIRDFVARFLKTKDLSVGFASASEVARTAQGDCTEHAVLLAALLRGNRIPSRVVSGLVYADQFLDHHGVFGYHMWTQAWVSQDGSGRWVDLDAALGARPFDATHIAVSTSSLSEAGMQNDLVNMLPLLGRLNIRIVEPAE